MHRNTIRYFRTRTCVRHRFDFLLEMQYDSIFYRQIIAVQANFVRLTHKVGLLTSHRRPNHLRWNDAPRTSRICRPKLLHFFSFKFN